MTSPAGVGSGRPIRWTAAAFLLVFGFLPIVNWIPGGHEAPWYTERVGEWLMDGAIVVGVGVVLAILSRRMTWLWRPGWFDPIAAAAHARPARTAALLGVGAFALYAVIAQVVFSAKPLLIDEIIQVWQARVLASGRLWVPTPEFPEFTSAMHLVDHEGRRFGQFPMGGPAMLAIGSLFRAEWLVGPLFGAVSAVVAWGLFRRIEARPGVALGAALLFAVAPFTAFMAGSHMSHVTGLTWLLVAMLGLARATGTDAPRWSDGLLCGLGLGIAATIRPVDAMAFALPAAIWLAWQAWRTRQWGAFLASGIGVAVPLALLLAANWATSGEPSLMGYALMWGGDVGPGFRTPPWGDPHTVFSGLELVSLYFLRLQLYLFEAPIPALLPAALALALAGRLRPYDRYLLVSSGLLVGAYWTYWHDGFYLGPRFMYPLVPLLSLWTARCAPSLRERWGARSVAYRVGMFGALASLPLVVVNVVTIRGQAYRSDMQSMRFDADKAAHQAGISGALILVRESWGAEVMVRLWARGVSRSDAEGLYLRVDTCQLDQELSRLEAEGVHGERALDRLRPLLADSSRVVRSGLSPDPSEMALDGASYPPRCIERIASSWEGFTLFAPHLLAGAHGNMFVRDMRERNSLLPFGRNAHPVYLMRPDGHRAGSEPRFIRVEADSVFGVKDQVSELPGTMRLMP
ncbi:MAG: hypothetical protein ABR551_05560 [Gemmatimonadales bacterium]